MFVDELGTESVKISVIIPVFRVSPYIERCVASVAQQRFTDVECLLVDDASDDDSMERAATWLRGYTGPIQFRTLLHDRNLGLSAARNTGIRAAQGDYVFFLDGDDALPIDSLERLVHVATRFPDVDLLQGGSEIIGSIGENKRYMLRESLPDFSNDTEWIGKTLLERKLIPVTSWNKLILRTWLIDNELYFKEGILHEDEHWTYMAASFVHSMAFCKHSTYSHFVNEGSIMRSQADKSIQSWMVILEDFISNQQDSFFCTRRKVILEVGFCNLVRIIKKGSKDRRREHVDLLRQVMEPFASEIRRKGTWLERWLLKWFYFPLPIMSLSCAKHIKGIYFRLLNTLSY